jgi:hypothetical protein
MASDLTFHLTGGASNSDPDDSLGGVGSSEVLSATALNNLFDNVNPDEVLTGDLLEYRAIDIVNDGDAEAHHVQFFLTDTPNVESEIHIWYDATGTQSIANETTPPVGSDGNWTQPLVGSKQSFSDLAAAGTYRIWVRRTVDQNADNINEDTATLHVWFS